MRKSVCPRLFDALHRGLVTQPPLGLHKTDEGDTPTARYKAFDERVCNHRTAARAGCREPRRGCGKENTWGARFYGHPATQLKSRMRQRVGTSEARQNLPSYCASMPRYKTLDPNGGDFDSHDSLWKSGRHPEK